MSSKEGSLTEDDSYMGYSVETINYYGTNISGAVVGTPRGDMLNGKVRSYLSDVWYWGFIITSVEYVFIFFSFRFRVMKIICIQNFGV